MKEVFILYGKETKGLPEWLLEKYINEKTIRIPMLPTLRSLNLSNSVAIITYEILIHIILFLLQSIILCQNNYLLLVNLQNCVVLVFHKL